MDKTLDSYLKKISVNYELYKHPAVFTVAEAIKNKAEIPEVFHTKNLFLRDENKKFFLICMNAFKKLNLKSLREKLGAKKKLSFASPEQLKANLNLAPGSVSIFGMIYAKNVALVIDKELWNAKKVGFHPNINSETIVLDRENLKKFVNSLRAEIKIFEL